MQKLSPNKPNHYSPQKAQRGLATRCFARPCLGRYIFRAMKNLLLLIIFVSLSSFATLPLEVSMLDIVTSSDHVLTVEVIGVEMIDENGKLIQDPEAMTGPGLSNVIQLICNVKETHITNADKVPSKVYIPLDNFMHFSLGQIQEYYRGEPYPIIAVLQGENFVPAYAGKFEFPMYELETIKALYTLKQ